MSVTSITTAGNPVSSGAAGQAAALGEQHFLQLLVTQLKNQDPTSPIDSQSFISQMAQLSSLEATNTLSTQVGQMVTGQQQMSALQLVGHNVQYSDNNGNTASGQVTGVRFGASSPMLQIGSTEVSMGQVQTVL